MPITQKNTILSIDWNLHMWSSHPGSICRNLLKADSTLAVLTYIELEDAPDPSWEKRIDRLLTVSDWFLEAKKVWHNPILDTFSEVWQISPKLYEQVDRYLESSAFKPKFIIVQDASFHNTLAISRLCKKRDIPVVFYFHTVRHRKFIGFFRAFIKNRKNVFFASIHPEIARKISKAIASRVHAVPYPVEIDACRSEKTSGPLVVKMLGKNRQEKNWELMPALLELISPMLRNNEVRLQLPNIIAASLRKFRDDPSISPNLRFHHINLQQGYFEELCSTDILILAYDPKTYDFRVSGIAEEATVAGIPFLISSGTLTANTYRDTGICREFDINDAADLAENLRVMVNNYKQYSESATKFSVSARKSHSGTTFLSTLSDITEGKIK